MSHEAPSNLPIVVAGAGSGGHLEIFAPRAGLQNPRTSDAFGVRRPFVFPVMRIRSRTRPTNPRIGRVIAKGA